MYYSKPVPLESWFYSVIEGKFLTCTGHGVPCSSVTGDVQGDKKLSPITVQKRCSKTTFIQCNLIDLGPPDLNGQRPPVFGRQEPPDFG